MAPKRRLAECARELAVSADDMTAEIGILTTANSIRHRRFSPSGFMCLSNPTELDPEIVAPKRAHETPFSGQTMRAQELGRLRNPLETASRLSVALQSDNRASQREIEYLRERAATLLGMALGPMPPSLVDQLLKVAADFEGQAAHLEKSLSFSNTAVAIVWNTKMLLFDPRLKFAESAAGWRISSVASDILA